MSTERYADREVELNQSGAFALQPEYQPLETLLADAIRRVRRSASGLTDRESQILSDVSRGRDARGLRLVTEALDIVRHRCACPADASAFGDAFSRYILAGHPGLVLPWMDTLRREGSTNTMADDALIEHILAPSKGTRERVYETHHAQMVASQAVCRLMLNERR